MPKKSLAQLQYENAKVENDVNKGCAVIGMGFITFFAIFFIGCIILANL